MIPAINDLPVWERTLLRQVRDAQASEGQLYRQLCDGFEASRRAAKYAPQPTTKREAVAQFVDIAYACAATVLQTPADYPAHVVNFALGLLYEATDYVNADMRAAQWG